MRLFIFVSHKISCMMKNDLILIAGIHIKKQIARLFQLANSEFNDFDVRQEEKSGDKFVCFNYPFIVSSSPFNCDITFPFVIFTFQCVKYIIYDWIPVYQNIECPQKIKKIWHNIKIKSHTSLFIIAIRNICHFIVLWFHTQMHACTHLIFHSVIFFSLHTLPRLV